MCSGFVPVPFCGKSTHAVRPGEAGVAADLCLPGWAEGALWLRKPPVCPAGLSSRGQRLPEAGETWLLRSYPRTTAAGARPPTPTPLFFFGSPQVHGLFSLSLGSLCTSVYFHLCPHSGDCRFLVAGMVYGLVTAHLVFQRRTRLPEARNLLAVSLSAPPVAVCE